MNTRKIPAVTMLSAGLITLVIIHVRGLRMPLNSILTTLLIVLLSFYIIGILIKAIVDFFLKKIEVQEQKEKELRRAEEKLKEQEELKEQKEMSEQEAK